MTNKSSLIILNKNKLSSKPDNLKLFIDMNSFFATCEQQVNYWLRGRPIAVCVYTGKNGFIISPSIEAKAKGIKLGLRLSEAIKICPDLVPLESNPNRYRDYHIKIMDILRKYSDDVIPKSIDEAIVDLTGYQLVYKDPVQLARNIKQDIQNNVGDWLKSSIGIAPNAFLAKLGSNLTKPNGLVVINKENINEILKPLQLRDLPGINVGMAKRLEQAGILTPLQLKETDPIALKKACNSIIGIYWHHRLNFGGEMDLVNHRYKSMQAKRMISKEQKKSVAILQDLFMTLCIRLERRMVKEGVFCNKIGFHSTYENGKEWKDYFKTGKPLQDGVELMHLIQMHMQHYEKQANSGAIINRNMVSMGVYVGDFVSDELRQIQLFENNIKKDNLRKLVYSIKDKFGPNKILRAMELKNEEMWKDVIGFGSIKDLHQ